MAVFPMYVDLKDKECLVVGGGEVAARKIELLLRFEAGITVVAPEICPSVSELVKESNIKYIQDRYSTKMLEGIFLVIAATSSKSVNEMVFRDAVERKLPVNVVDAPELCTFIFPSVIKRGDLTIGISTSGAYPALSKRLRVMAEELFTEEYSQMVELLAGYRSRIRSSGLTGAEKEKLLNIVLDDLYSGGNITPEALKAILQVYYNKYGLME
ncbi:siroheme synthase [Ruminiclostridium hungatei]|uniref:precorrin-2 dehydrogenase n=1 Tax=Ruminiclostridium hungatei TaxID=48256 RepID=A0A1V4SEM4_RUMHU|nr:bifunctional precorrin-2 dehydrogenase/sirohydrochlorin ferrochelatase [Ruminiclostridium hungatei]OPX42300.1 siroheme synthase [Ruminiclostridium hungatei]